MNQSLSGNIQSTGAIRPSNYKTMKCKYFDQGMIKPLYIE